MSNTDIIIIIAVAIGLTFTAIAHEYYYNTEFTFTWRGHCDAVGQNADYIFACLQCTLFIDGRCEKMEPNFTVEAQEWAR